MKSSNVKSLGKVFALAATFACIFAIFVSCNNAANGSDSSSSSSDSGNSLSELEQKLVGKWLDSSNNGFELKSDRSYVAIGHGVTPPNATWRATSDKFILAMNGVDYSEHPYTVISETKVKINNIEYTKS